MNKRETRRQLDREEPYPSVSDKRAIFKRACNVFCKSDDSSRL